MDTSHRRCERVPGRILESDMKETGMAWRWRSASSAGDCVECQIVVRIIRSEEDDQVRWCLGKVARDLQSEELPVEAQCAVNVINHQMDVTDANTAWDAIRVHRSELCDFSGCVR